MYLYICCLFFNDNKYDQCILNTVASALMGQKFFVSIKLFSTYNYNYNQKLPRRVRNVKKLPRRVRPSS